MRGWRLGGTPAIGVITTSVGVILLALGALVGWVLPHLNGWFSSLIDALPFARDALTPVAGSGIDPAPIVGADLTTLAVIIAVLIGYNVAEFQIASQTLSLAFTRTVLLTLGPLFLVWTAVTFVALIYLMAPLYLGQLWQTLLWFGAVVLFMIAYLWNLPWRLSGEYAARSAIRSLRSKPMATWEAQDGFAALQASISGANARSDLGTTRAMTATLGAFLCAAQDRKAESDGVAYNRARYRALKNLLTGCAQQAGDAPTTVAYYLGFLTAGVTLQAVAVGHPMDYADSNLYSGLMRALPRNPEYVNALWTGFRHALCRDGDRGEAYLLRYWRDHARWDTTDERNVTQIAKGVVRFHSNCWEALQGTLGAEEAEVEAVEMLDDLYRYISYFLFPEAKRDRQAARLTALATQLLEAVHERALQGPFADERYAALVIEAHDKYRATLT
jgi:hypothetical protein